MSPSIIISTYNQPSWLEKVLWGYQCQSHQNFDIIIADDGSSGKTQEVIDRYQKILPQKITHVWHEDTGFQKSAILNKAIERSSSDYLIFTDGDCIPRKDFIQTHLSLAEKNTFLSGGYCKLPMDISKSLTKENIQSGEAFDTAWLKKLGFDKKSSLLKLALKKTSSKAMDILTPTKATWNGCNSSTWRKYILTVNGHNETMQYGGEDREMGMRLINNGIKSKQVRNRAILLHLDHSRGYDTPESISRNLLIRKHTDTTQATWTDHGITRGSKP